ncbi:hypothetical protein [Falsiroseomonas selenitidurans]|uniref:Uncharacterized protein n=1 Tax=Falsiroseomonas selenitidurans TaxID=2716335 RepID=A0ABX1E3T1_9PROT|nr:hypothetical protein [Falsiroseomonas selenitidurans]NKC30172.1 hypothetical protein [Falsiroseomonas selenitidurans]
MPDASRAADGAFLDIARAYLTWAARLPGGGTVPRDVVTFAVYLGRGRGLGSWMPQHLRQAQLEARSDVLVRQSEAARLLQALPAVPETEPCLRRRVAALARQAFDLSDRLLGPDSATSDAVWRLGEALLAELAGPAPALPPQRRADRNAA